MENKKKKKKKKKTKSSFTSHVWYVKTHLYLIFTLYINIGGGSFEKKIKLRRKRIKGTIVKH
ncbi:hypothetical protein HanRHA438_Chr17g0836971 [Helianthus annuus]|nr:hypothetical protein HanRHA438_Chr17g0836971 [Helianthus annuus]